MLDILALKNLFENHLSENLFKQAPVKLYEPINYILQLESKRIRPALMLAVAEMYDLEFQPFLEPALGIEIFHNFTLMHDDIMDKATLRRGKPTVHMQYGQDAAILSGDAMEIIAAQKISSVDQHILKPVMDLFNQTAIEVCCGQQMDMDFEKEWMVSEWEYLRMIELKTAVLVACSLKMGGTIAMASEKDLEHLYEFGREIGIAFQLQDDLLDAFGEEAQVGKRIGGDICNNKKTLLFIRAMQTQQKYDKEILQNWLQTSEYNETKIEQIKKVFVDSYAKDYTEKKMMSYYHSALEHLQAISVNESKKKVLYDFAELVVKRLK